MSEFFKALTEKDLLGENLMPTHSTSGNTLVDLFFKMGGARGNPQELVPYFPTALSDDTLNSLKAMFYLRDIRGGMGERDSFRYLFRYLCLYHPNLALNNLMHIPFYGRWDDLIFTTYNTPLENEAFDLIFHALKSGDKLCAKWMPREGKKYEDIAKRLALYIFAGGKKKSQISSYVYMSALKNYRKLLAGNTQVVENLMCKNQWGKINYEHVPSMAMRLYRRAFSRHDGERFGEFLTAVEKGEKKISAGAIFPHDIGKAVLNSLYYGRDSKLTSLELRVLQEQWNSLPNYLPNEDYGILPICDVSGSMSGLPMEVSISLGLYLSERNKGAFENLLVTFSGRPAIFKVPTGNLADKITAISRMDWGMNTDLEAVFNLILRQARKTGLEGKYMPKILLILSDMQFDQCVRNYSDTGMEMIKRMYAESGYKLPQIVFWNLRTSVGVPVKFDEKGTALVSGFSPSILTAILGGDLEPVKVVMKALNNERYERISV